MLDSEEFRAGQAPLKQLYRDQPERAKTTMTSSSQVDDSASITCSIKTGQLLKQAGLAEGAGGGQEGQLCSGDMLLEALVACAGVTLKAVATSMGIPLKKANIVAEADLDWRGTLGISKDVPVGFTDIRLKFDIDAGETEREKACSDRDSNDLTLTATDLAARKVGPVDRTLLRHCSDY
ncbi:hypothetical protein OIV83_002938 [Microbotryomycetes sp. JL201]|nr:hypothetical protein OIV83_002938 [Microbotryomycetes sp. JL201]